jgi:hypothetical protein
MTKARLKEILIGSDFFGVKTQLKKEGFFDARRRPSLRKSGMKVIVHGKSEDIEGVKSGNYYYNGSVITGVKGLEGYTWLWLAVLKRAKNCSTLTDGRYVPHKVLLYVKEER